MTDEPRFPVQDLIELRVHRVGDVRQPPHGEGGGAHRIHQCPTPIVKNRDHFTRMCQHAVQVLVLSGQRLRQPIEIGDHIVENLVPACEGLRELRGLVHQPDDRSGVPLQGLDHTVGQIVDLCGIQHAEQRLEPM
ncbi:Uncharacterised protein [Mycobacteroides abscessus subsp. abscessus]|nr:Uncharacterised protein [Mycobacteroides abscessus subsp. abscessus]